MILVVFALPPPIGSYVKMGRNFTREAEDLRIELERWDQLHWIQDDKIYQKLNSFYQISKLMNSVNTLIHFCTSGPHIKSKGIQMPTLYIHVWDSERTY